ncbi:hypothetical protein [Pontixanthobacter sp. CEM42]|uniref:hypothetical protein n=1 Tax=Pontixanthobacter sp. CEM42 TaxID=2792077 RepID=UPI001AE0A13F|nr:hypothetical protein [Pontixanthobacter sp. CEM42]
MQTIVHSVGLAGDGDEIWAIEEVERAFDVKLDKEDAPNWVTAGDVFASLQKKLPDSVHLESELWDKFAVALSQETAVDPKTLSPDSPLILEGHPWRKISALVGWGWGIALAFLLFSFGAAIVASL